MEPWANYLEPWMCDDDAAWWAKTRNAERHLEALTAAAAEFNDSEPFTLTREATDDPERFAWRGHIHRSVPADIATGIGDVLHNLASALDSVAYALAQQTLGRDLTRTEERATTFPVCRDPDVLEQFFEAKNRKGKPIRAHLFDQRARQALQRAQPYYWTSRATDMPADEQVRRYEEEYVWSLLKRLRALNNIDKHRRVAAFRRLSALLERNSAADERPVPMPQAGVERRPKDLCRPSMTAAKAQMISRGYAIQQWCRRP